MLSYQHGYHAGNFADVVKHLTLTRLLNYLTQKDKPLLYLETHSGKGLYDLKHAQAQKTKEYVDGIQHVWEQLGHLTPEYRDYIAILKTLNPQDQLRYYPGSPYIALELLRPTDRAYLCELHPAEHQLLQTLPNLRRKAHVECCDGIEQLKALLPPAEKRGLIFIDPSYEIKAEYQTIPKAIQEAYLRFPTGVFCLWYPIVKENLHQQLISRLKQIPAEKTLHVEFKLDPLPPNGMTACGLWIINPPYTLAQELKSALGILTSIINPGSSEYLVET